ncbi:FHIPEP domain protein [Leptospira yanagawae serovar Saopaulo str. Sao Paulo = ATCC 700523]|uniref:FHIPEP domain protein n=1 Tax=Leptospira yanagawae serovar Saopaulo str. Sao Paulo = ATCC 700523 TaxID=1249483 RepID=A0A5E8HHJ4_9LEPT|nr:FHIPEP family type III secretion protein [Leptospira yanagawae]EOQ90749.1 FHIPEP domain protein [Leptospira yanagawae serovar Saopaulo str. Sao Paulo = ATCC 700523]
MNLTPDTIEALLLTIPFVYLVFFFSSDYITSEYTRSFINSYLESKNPREISIEKQNQPQNETEFKIIDILNYLIQYRLHFRSFGFIFIAIFSLLISFEIIDSTEFYLGILFLALVTSIYHWVLNYYREKLIGRKITFFQEFSKVTILICFLYLLIEPTKGVLIDLFIYFYISLELFILSRICFVRERIYFKSFPKLIFMISIFRLLITFSITRSVISKGFFIDSSFFNFIFNLLLTLENSTLHPIYGIISLVFLTVIGYTLSTYVYQITSFATEHSVFREPADRMFIDSAINMGNFTEKEAKFNQKKLSEDLHFMAELDSTLNSVIKQFRFCLLLSILILIGSIMIGFIFRGESFTEIKSTYLIYSVSLILFCIVSGLFSFLSIVIAILKPRKIGFSNLKEL